MLMGTAPEVGCGKCVEAPWESLGGGRAGGRLTPEREGRRARSTFHSRGPGLPEAGGPGGHDGGLPAAAGCTATRRCEAAQSELRVPPGKELGPHTERAGLP